MPTLSDDYQRIIVPLRAAIVIAEAPAEPARLALADAEYERKAARSDVAEDWIGTSDAIAAARAIANSRLTEAERGLQKARTAYRRALNRCPARLVAHAAYEAAMVPLRAAFASQQDAATRPTSCCPHATRADWLVAHPNGHAR